MSLENVLRNIYGYVELLQTVCTDQVASWDRQSLHDAFQWAKYCEQVYVQAQGKPYLEQLEHSVRRIDGLPWAIGERKLSLETLKEAVTTLKQALLQNPNVPDGVYEELICSYGNPKTAPSSLVKDIVDVGTIVQTAVVATACSPCPCMTQDIAVTMERVNLYSCAQILLEYAAKLMSCPSERLTQCEKLLVSKLDRIGTDTEGLEVVTISCSLPSVKCGSSKAQTSMVNWLLGHTKLQSLVFTLPRHLLPEVSLVHFVFYKAYMQHLISTVQGTEVVISQNGHITYRLPGETTFKHFVSRFCSLVKVGDPVTAATMNTVKILARNDGVGMWRKLLNKILTV